MVITALLGPLQDSGGFLQGIRVGLQRTGHHPDRVFPEQHIGLADWMNSLALMPATVISVFQPLIPMHIRAYARNICARTSGDSMTDPPLRGSPSARSMVRSASCNATVSSPFPSFAAVANGSNVSSSVSSEGFDEGDQFGGQSSDSR